LHLLIRGKTRTEIQNFLRTVPALVAIAVTGTKKGNPFKGRFWNQLVYSRMLTSWQREFKSVLRYIELNTRETLGLVAKRVRDTQALNSG